MVKMVYIMSGNANDAKPKDQDRLSLTGNDNDGEPKDQDIPSLEGNANDGKPMDQDRPSMEGNANDVDPMDQDRPSLEVRCAIIAATTPTSDINETGPDRSPSDDERGHATITLDRPLEDSELPEAYQLELERKKKKKSKKHKKARHE